MSQENVELAHQLSDAFNRRGLGAFPALMDADVDAVSFLTAREGDYHGHDGIRRWWEKLFDTFPDFTTEVVTVRDLGDVTVTVLRNRGHGASGDTPIEQMLWHAAAWRDAKVV